MLLFEKEMNTLVKSTISKVCPEFESLIVFCISRASPLMTKENISSKEKSCKNHVKVKKKLYKEGETYKNNFKKPQTLEFL